MGSLSRDTATANGSISPIFDKEKEQKRLQTAQAVGEITGQMVSIVNTMGDIKGLEEAKKGAAPLKDNATEKERAKWLAGLRESDAYQKAMSDYGVGSKNQMVVQAIGGVLQGLVNGNISQAVAGAANPLVAQVIKAQTTDAGGNTNVVANAMAHAVWGAVAAQMSGGNAAAGAAGAFSGELATRFIAEAFYHASTPEDIARLSQADKEQLSLMGTIAAGAAGAMAGNSSAAAATGALAGKNAVENNFLSQGSPQKYTDKYKECNGNAGCEQGVRKDMAQESAENIQKLKSCWDAGDAACVADTRSRIELDEKAYTELRQQDNMAGRAYEDSAKWYANIIDQCAGKCDWLEASLLKTGVGVLGNLVYGALGVGSVPSGKPGSATTVENSGAKGVIPNTNSALKLGERAIINEVNVTRVGRWMSPDELAQM